MENLKLLRRRVKAAWQAESTLTPDERRQHSWQFVTRQSGQPYLVGKGDANTFYYSVGENVEPTFVMPDEMFAVLDSWCNSRFVYYCIAKGKQLGKVRYSSEKEAMKRKGSKFVGCAIVGVTGDNKKKSLYRYREGLTGSGWFKIK